MKLKRIGWLILTVLAVGPLGSGHAQESALPDSNAAASAAVALSPAAADVVRLAESGVSAEVLIAYIKNSSAPFNLSADAILYLKDQGMASEALTAMLNHDAPAPGATPPPPGGQYAYDQKPYAPTTLPPPPLTEQVPPPTQPLPEQPVPAPIQTAPVLETAPAAYVSQAPPEVNYFYNDLSPYGSWLYLEGYGWCWQPRTVAVNREWRPYCDGGHWADTSAGWCWQSEYSWGWAPFHYGRWHLHPRSGWVWFPDTTWGPGWVTWRSDREHCGWAPLPFRAEFDARGGYRYNGVSVRADFDFGLGAGLFTFIALRDFSEHDYAHRRLSPTEVTRIYNNTTIINNYTVNNNHVVVNRGIPKAQVEAVTHTKIQTLAIRNEPGGRGVVKGGGAANGVIYRRELKAPAAPVRAVAQRVDEQHPVIQHAAIVPARMEQKQFSTPAATPHRATQPAGQNNVPRSQNNLTPTIRQPVATTQTQQPHPAANVTTPRSPQNIYMAPSVRPPQASQVASPTRPAVGANGYVPMKTLVQSQGTPVQNQVAPQQYNQVYYPKSFHQAAEVRPVAPRTQPMANSTVRAPQSQPPSVAQPQNRPANSGRDNNNQPK